MHIGEIMKADSANGIGMRVSIFVSGCTNHCEGCFQPETWDFNFGEEYTPVIEQEIVDELAKPFYQGLTILGGEPFEPSNQETLIGLIRRVRWELPKRSIWMYTGFVYEDLLQGGCRYVPEITDEILDNIDVLVDGKFVQNLKKITLNFRGSSNQRIIDVKKTRAAGKVILDPLNN